VKFASVTMRVLRGGDSEVGAAGEDERDRGGLALEEEWTEESRDELDRGERSSGLLEGV
jgi:hypothetical protein